MCGLLCLIKKLLHEFIIHILVIVVSIIFFSLVFLSSLLNFLFIYTQSENFHLGMINKTCLFLFFNFFFIFVPIIRS